MTEDQEIRVKALEIAIDYYKSMRPTGYATSKLDIVIQSATKLVPYIKDGVAEPGEVMDQSDPKNKKPEQADTHMPPRRTLAGIVKR